VALVFWTAALSLLALAWTLALGLAFWFDIDAAEREALAALLSPRLSLGVLMLCFLPVLFAAVLRILQQAYPRAALRMCDELHIITRVSPGHRIAPAGAPEMRALGAAINELADAHCALHDQIGARIEDSHARLTQERNQLAALMSELTQGVLVCNRAGRILLYNAQASALLEAAQGPAEASAGAPVGLNRSVFGLLDKGPIVHAMDQVLRRLEQKLSHPVAHFVTSRRAIGTAAGGEVQAVPGGQLLRAQMVPVQDDLGALSGFVLILDDITREVARDARRDFLLQQLTEGTRASLANLRAAAETLHDHPLIAAAMRDRFLAVVFEESLRLSRQLEEALAGSGDPPRSPWPREDILAGDLVFALQRSFESQLELASRVEGLEAPLWLHLDSHALMQALTHLVGLVATALSLTEVVIQITGKGRFARIDVCWSGAPLDPSQLHECEAQEFALGADGRPVTLGAVLQQHGAEIWSLADRKPGRQRLCLQLPTSQPEQLASTVPVRSRPVYYDFDLFHQAGQSDALDEKPLAELSYTVFDTETTGLEPSEGDEIIAIGAVRIVNSRLLAHECFDRLIKPRRAVRPESQRIHGITPQMLADQPALEQVLPGFARFAEDTVLIAHNAAFDMRFLEMARERTGLRFEQPVLDTLLLSSLVQPGHHDAEHGLEHIAGRLGVAVVGRHTALGDAIVTGEVFLKLLPMLAERGIRNLRQAREASQKSVYATLEY
jgi:DNA polymerase-3 subunit epsilon